MSCKCQKCEKKYNIDFLVPDHIWELIKPEGKDEGAGLLCGACICSKLEEITANCTTYELIRLI